MADRYPGEPAPGTLRYRARVEEHRLRMVASIRPAEKKCLRCNRLVVRPLMLCDGCHAKITAQRRERGDERYQEKRKQANLAALDYRLAFFEELADYSRKAYQNHNGIPWQQLAREPRAQHKGTP